MCRVSTLRCVPKRNVPKKNAQGILQGAWMPYMGSMACYEVDPQNHLIKFKEKRDPAQIGRSLPYCGTDVMYSEWKD
jgi:hypothetical protein